MKTDAETFAAFAGINYFENSFADSTIINQLKNGKHLADI